MTGFKLCSAAALLAADSRPPATTNPASIATNFILLVAILLHAQTGIYTIFISKYRAEGHKWR
jgi:succinate dehydrogenase hydrophobic anchor subunit